MNKQKLISLLRRMAMPAALIALGCILTANPDVVSALIGKLLGWAMILAGILCGVSAVITRRSEILKGISAVALAVAGGWICAHPLALAAWLIRLIGALILLSSIVDLSYANGSLRLMPLISAIVGGVLLFLPITTSRLVFTLCGIAVILIGCLLLVVRLRSQNRLTAPENPDIIDAL